MPFMLAKYLYAQKAIILNRIALVAQVITAMATVIAATMLFVLLRNTQLEKQSGSDAAYFHECYQTFITEFPLTKYKGTSEEYLAEARKACP